jgi:putative membrane protein
LDARNFETTARWGWKESEMNRLTTLRTVAAAALVVAAAVVAPAQQTAPPATRPAAKPAALARADREFIQTVAKGEMAEVALGELAGRQAKSDEVKKFGRRMVDDHGKANQELTQRARDKSVELPKEPDRTQQGMHDRLSKLTGEAFDRAYVEEMVKDHRKDVKAFEQEAGRAKDPDLKAWIDKTLPTLREHLREIENISAKVLAKK